MTRALASAHELGSRSFALRAATSLARLYHARGRSAAARDLLAPIHGQFTEGFETADWMAAKALLEEIGGSV
jgi:predicted ATPase